MHSRDGFTVIELLIVILIAGIVAGMAFPRVGRAVALHRLDRATSVVTADLQLAATMAARQRRPVEVFVDEDGRRLEVRDESDATLTFSERHLGNGSGFEVQHVVIETKPTKLIVYPNGLTNGVMEIRLQAVGEWRRVRMSSAGQITVVRS